MADKIEIVKGTLFVDLDGTVLHSKTEHVLEEAVEKLKTAKANGWQIIITTFRGSQWGKDHKFGVPSTLSTLRLHDIPFDDIVWNSPSPRVIINNEPCYAIPHKRDGSWESYDF